MLSTMCNIGYPPAVEVQVMQVVTRSSGGEVSLIHDICTNRDGDHMVVNTIGVDLHITSLHEAVRISRYQLCGVTLKQELA